MLLPAARRALFAGVAVSFACAPDAPRAKGVLAPPEPTGPPVQPEAPAEVDAATPPVEPVADPPHFIGARTRGAILTACKDVERASELDACRRAGEGDHVTAVLPLACWFPGERRWSSGSGCAVRRGLRFSAASPPSESARPWVAGGCYGTTLALGIGPDEVAGEPAVIVSPPEHAPAPAAAGQAVPVAAVRSAVAADLKERGFDLKPVWRTLAQTVSTGIEITGDDAADAVVAVSVGSRSDQRYGGIFWIPGGTGPLVRIDSMHWPSVEYALAGTTDLDGNGRREIVIRYSHESSGTTVYAWREGDLTLLGSTSCGP
jgi:hypothetical protein